MTCIDLGALAEAEGFEATPVLSGALLALTLPGPEGERVEVLQLREARPGSTRVSVYPAPGLERAGWPRPGDLVERGGVGEMLRRMREVVR